MTITMKALVTLLVLGLAIYVYSERKGPAQQAGEKIDHAVLDVKNSAKELKDKVADR